ncbi:hypothetical protein B0H10DRAFT_1964775, partial [Mycena sp. CBHHK59/15]
VLSYLALLRVTRRVLISLLSYLRELYACPVAPRTISSYFAFPQATCHVTVSSLIYPPQIRRASGATRAIPSYLALFAHNLLSPLFQGPASKMADKILTTCRTRPSTLFHRPKNYFQLFRRPASKVPCFTLSLHVPQCPLQTIFKFFRCPASMTLPHHLLHVKPLHRVLWASSKQDHMLL